MPPRLSIKERDREALSQAERIEFGRRNRKTAWAWGSGPLVVFVHGWGGRGTQLAPLARHVAAQGFQSVVFDATAHGESKGWRATFRDFVSDVAGLSEQLGKDVYAYVGHSAGGLCMMAARALEGIHAEHYVCLCAPRGPYVPVHAIRKKLNVSDAVLERCRTYYSELFDSSWDELDSGHAFAYSNHGKLLLIYDEDDDQVEHTDGERIKAIWPSAKLVKTRGLGHQKVLWNPEVINEVAMFLQPA